MTTNCPLVRTGALVTVVHWMIGARLAVCFSTKPVAVFVQARLSSWLASDWLTNNDGTGATLTQEENSEVLLALSVAVAVMT